MQVGGSYEDRVKQLKQLHSGACNLAILESDLGTFSAVKLGAVHTMVLLGVGGSTTDIQFNSTVRRVCNQLRPTIIRAVQWSESH